MNTRLHVGARQLESTLAAYAKRFDLLEVKMDAIGHGSPTPASASALRRWRRQVPPSFDFAVVASSALARLKPDGVVEREVADMRQAADALEARVLVVRTPPDVTPASVWRERLARVVARLPRDVVVVVWEPHGVWEHDDAADLARKLGVVLAVDAAREEVPGGPVAYVRLRALGETRSFGAAALERVAHAIGARRDAFVVIETESALSECKALRRLAQEGARPAAARALVRPRLRVRDDEQE